MSLKQRIKHLCKSQKGEANYISMTISLVVICMAIAFLLNLFSVLYGKFQLDQACNEVVKMVQLNGGVPDDITSFIAEYDENNNNINGLRIVSFSPSIGASNPGMVAAYQLGEQFTITLACDGYLGIGGMFGSDITIQSTGIGVSEHYHKH